ncbi:chemotaxis protein CheC [Methanothermococcus sp. Ax23]|jgi:chemotaxis protein CheC|uniref:chemotaxis protein CheC n=1 Tax=Methanothermococcus sp. Ax23 TaxID=3156486 RepID=UPI003BA3BB12
MKIGNVCISPNSWNTIMQSIINEEMKAMDEKMSSEKSNFIKNFRVNELSRIEEIGKSAAEKAAGFITDMTGNPVEVGVVNVVLTTPSEIKEEIKDDYKIFTGIKFSGDITGIGVLIFSEESALKLSKSMLAEMGMDDDEDDFNEMKISAINETCNLLISAYVDTLANFINTSLSMTPPYFIKGSEKEIIEKVFKSCKVGDNDIVLTFKSELFSHGIGSGFEVLIVMPSDSINVLFQKL